MERHFQLECEIENLGIGVDPGTNIGIRIYPFLFTAIGFSNIISIFTMKRLIKQVVFLELIGLNGENQPLFPDFVEFSNFPKIFKSAYCESKMTSIGRIRVKGCACGPIHPLKMYRTFKLDYFLSKSENFENPSVP